MLMMLTKIKAMLTNSRIIKGARQYYWTIGSCLQAAGSETKGGPPGLVGSGSTSFFGEAANFST